MIIQEIDETNFEKIYDEDKEITENKFVMVKSFEGHKSSDESLEKWGKLMQDPTCWAYAYLKDKQGNSLKLYPFQDRLINDKNRFVIGTAANQIGKTLSMCVKALHHACYVPNALVLIISRSEDQSIRILDEIKWLMRFGNISFDEIKDEIENRTEIHLKSKGESGIAIIKCVPPTDAALAYYATLIIMDEVGFWELDKDPIKYFYQIVETRTNTTYKWLHEFLTMGQIVIISNPNGQQGLLWHLWKEDKRFNCYRFNWLAKPENLLEEFLEKKKNLPADVFDSSYDAVFSSATGSFILLDEYNNACRFYDMDIPKGAQLFLGADFAGEDTHSRDVDLTALIGVIKLPGNPVKLKLVYYQVFPPRVKKRQVYEIIEDLASRNVVKFAYDKVGVGDSVLEDLKERGKLNEIQIIPLTYSLPNKSEVYWNLKHLFEQGRLEIREIPELKEQLLGLKFEKTGGGYMKNGLMQSYIKVHHATEKIHDDICFVAGTKILTDRGQIPIEKIKIGDLVMTRKGLKKVDNIGNRKAKVIKNIGLTGTPNHPIITKQGIKKLINVEVSDIVYIWNEKQSSIMEKNIIDILNPIENNCKIIIGPIQNGKNHQNHCTDRFGKIFMEKFQKVGLFIIKIITPSIISLKILKSYPLVNMLLLTCNQKKENKSQEKIWINMQDQKQYFGINQKKEENGINKKQLSKVLGKRKVYNLKVEDCNEYFANNILVHNCDAFANACFIAMREATPDYDYSFIPTKKTLFPQPLIKKKYEMRVMCKDCQHDWDYTNEQECPYCRSKEILDYCTEKPINLYKSEDFEENDEISTKNKEILE